MATGTPTPNLGLLSWAGTDYALRTEFNQNFSTIDTWAGSVVKLSNTSPFTANQTAPAWIASGLTGAQGTGRWVGVTTQAGAPTSGTYNAGDWVIDPFTPGVWVCTSAGTPGTWGPAGSVTSVASSSSPGTVEVVENSATPVVPTRIASFQETEITGTSAQNVLTYTPKANHNFELGLSFRVVTGTTTVTIQVTYTDAGGNESYYVLNAQSCAVGNYSCVPFSFNATTGGAITVSVTVGTANQVYVSGSLKAV